MRRRAAAATLSSPRGGGKMPFEILIHRAAGISLDAVEKSRVSLAPETRVAGVGRRPARRTQQKASPLLRCAPEPSCRGEDRPPWHCPGGARRGASRQALFLLDGARLVVYPTA